MFKSQEYEKKHICPSNNFGCTMLQGLFYCFHLLSVLSSQNEPSVLSHTLPLPFYSQCSPAKDGTSSMHLLLQPATDPILTTLYMHLLKKKEIKVNSRKGLQHLAVLLLCDSLLTTSEGVQNSRGKEKYIARLWTFSFERKNIAPPMNIKGNLLPLCITQLFLRYRYLHLYCRTSKRLSLSNIVGPEGPASSGAKSVQWWVAVWWISKQGPVMSYLLFELLNRVLLCFLNSMWIWL